MCPTDRRDIENTRWRNCSNQRLASNQQDFLSTRPAGFVDHAQWTKCNGDGKMNNIWKNKTKKLQNDQFYVSN